jgi:hypothetical protein
MKKAYHSKSNTINTCIGCNQACLDHAFIGKKASCLVNPSACHETELDLSIIGNRNNDNSSNGSNDMSGGSSSDSGGDNKNFTLPLEDRLNIGYVILCYIILYQ